MTPFQAHNLFACRRASVREEVCSAEIKSFCHYLLPLCYLLCLSTDHVYRSSFLQPKPTEAPNATGPKSLDVTSTTPQHASSRRYVPNMKRLTDTEIMQFYQCTLPRPVPDLLVPNRYHRLDYLVHAEELAHFAQTIEMESRSRRAL